MNKLKCKVPFGTMNISDVAKQRIIHMLSLNTQVTNGSMVKYFEEQFAWKFRTKHAVAVSSGTDACTIALASLGLNRGDEVIIPALTFVATANAVVNAGLVPKFVDVEPDTLNIDPVLLEKAINLNTKAVMIVHLMGKPCNMHEILKIVKKHKIYLIEDCAEAHGAEYYGMPVGSFGDIACYSLYAAHIVSSIEGGMITTNNDALAEACRSLRNHGLKLNGSNWTFNKIGFSSKMNEIEAVVGIGNLHNFDTIISKRKENFQYLTDGLAPFWRHIYTIKPGEYDILSPHAFAILVNPESIDKDEFVRYLTINGIDNRNLFYSIPTQADCYKYLGYSYGQFPMAEESSLIGTHIGIHQDLTKEQLDYVIDSIKEYIDANNPT